LVLALPAAWTLATLKIISEPIPAVAAFGFGLPMGLFFCAAYLSWDGLLRRFDDGRAVLAFPALMAAAEWVQATLTPLASWGAAAYMQLENLPLLQLASLLGTQGVGWVLYFFAAAVEHAWAFPAARRRWLVAAFSLALFSLMFGHARLSSSSPSSSVKAAAVGTDASFSGLPLPSQEETAKVEEALFLRTQKAAEGGASLVIWNEAATLVEAEREEAFLKRAGEAAAQARAELVVAYIKPVSTKPLLFENKYAWLRPDGTLAHEYLKSEPVPGEPAVRGAGPVHVVDAAFGKAGGAICYDYDFPRLAMRHAKLGVGVVALPSSDWRGIEPIHTQMAALRAIEGGFSIVRSTRMGLSAGIDFHGRLRGWLSANETEDKILWVTLPSRQVTTLYSKTGDALVYAGMAFVLFLLLWRRGWR
jgi:apolipoprotein N-acyltransferase